MPDLEQTIVMLAFATVKSVLTAHDITDQSQAKRLVRERASQDELERYTLARETLLGLGVLD